MGGQFSHQRYGLQQNQSQMMSPANTPQGTLQFMNSSLSVQAMAQNFMAQFDTPRPRSDLGSQERITPNAMNPHRSLLGPVPSFSAGQQQAQQNSTPSTPVMAMKLPPSGAMAPPPQPVASEWPQQRPKTGPPPGTKITDSVPDIIVRPIFLPPNTRLTSEQVNSEIESCRELLADAGEHVSMERVHDFVLQKFQVQFFGRLNLRERHFDNLPAARELSMLLGKVNSYIQNFVRSRSMCTLYELGECCREFHPEKKSFDHLRLGPLQKMPLVYDLFKFPHDEYIPEITTIDLMEHLNHYLTKYQKWTTRTEVTDFMKYLCEEAFKVESAFSLGVRMRSLPLAIQTMKKAQRDSATTRRYMMENLKEVLNQDVSEAFAKFRASLLQTSEEGKHELRLHYMNLTPEVAVKELFTKFELLSHIFSTDPSMQRKVDRLHKTFQAFVSVVLEVPIPRMLYHLSVCLSNLEVHESATEFMVQEREQQQQQEQARQAAQQQRHQNKKTIPTRAKLVEKMLSYLNKCLDSGQMQLSYLQTIEAYLLKDFQFETFSEMGYGRFLELLLKEPKLTSLLEECGGTMLGSSSKGHHSESLYKPGLPEVQELLCQANHAGKHGVTATSDFMALEVEPGRLLKICTFSGPEQFESALLAEDPRLAAGHLVSLIVTNKGVEGAPLALLANHVKNTLLTLHARSSAFSTPGGPPSFESQKTIDLAVQFVVQMLVAIPLRICVAVAEQFYYFLTNFFNGKGRTYSAVKGLRMNPRLEIEQSCGALANCHNALKISGSTGAIFAIPLFCFFLSLPEESLASPLPTSSTAHKISGIIINISGVDIIINTSGNIIIIISHANREEEDKIYHWQCKVAECKIAEIVECGIWLKWITLKTRPITVSKAAIFGGKCIYKGNNKDISVAHKKSEAHKENVLRGVGIIKSL
ncbi:tudor domain-containing protein [Elysia marginata]|uniref:Tudor domain-containing protein n=1 Tax=Elysia marginata TaxID=1093978 RepID=A0AAV4IZM0_9GAST|nr:tudor domain-containing protein [Elysia marginata]